MKEQIKNIVRLQAVRVEKRLAEKKIKMQLEESAVDVLANKGYEPAFGARPVKRVVQQELETALAKGILRGDFGEDDTVVVSASPDMNHIVVSKLTENGNGAAYVGGATGAELNVWWGRIFY